MDGLRRSGTYVMRAGSEIPPGWERLVEAMVAGAVVVVCSLTMIFGYQIDTGNKVGGSGGVVVHKVAGGRSTSRKGRGRRPQPARCIALCCKDAIKEDGLGCLARGSAR